VSTSPRPESIHDRAIADLRYIRSAVENAGEFTAVPGRGGVAMGGIGAAAAVISSFRLESPVAWLTVWLMAACAAVVVGLVSMVRKSRRAGGSLVAAPARRFALAYIPAIGAGAALTGALAARGLFELLPALWLLLYGVAVAAGGAMSVRVVPIMGVVLLALGLMALFVPFPAGNVLLGAGFGVVQIVTGFVIWRRYGG
jgi:hypothetical protein